MEFWASVNVLRRRWYVFIPCLVAFGALAGLVLAGIKPSYEMSGKVVFIQPQAPGNSSNTPVNPLADLSGGASFATSFAQVLVNNGFKDQLVKAGASPNYTIQPPFASNEFMIVTTSAATPEAAVTSYKTLNDLLSSQAAEFQRSISPNNKTYFVPKPLGPPDGPTKIIGARVKALIIVFALGLIVSLGLTFLVDSVLSARARRKSARVAPVPIEVATSTGPFRLLDQLSDPGYRSQPDHPDESGRAAGT